MLSSRKSFTNDLSSGFFSASLDAKTVGVDDFASASDATAFFSAGAASVPATALSEIDSARFFGVRLRAGMEKVRIIGCVLLACGTGSSLTLKSKGNFQPVMTQQHKFKFNQTIK